MRAFTKYIKSIAKFFMTIKLAKLRMIVFIIMIFMIKDLNLWAVFFSKSEKKLYKINLGQSNFMYISIKIFFVRSLHFSK